MGDYLGENGGVGGQERIATMKARRQTFCFVKLVI